MRTYLPWSLTFVARFSLLAMLGFTGMNPQPVLGQVVAGPNSAAASYNQATGEITVSANGVNNWYIESGSSSLTGSAPVGLPAAGGLLSDSAIRIGETALADFTYANLQLGPVAKVSLPCGPDLLSTDLKIYFNGIKGQPVQSQPVQCAAEPLMPGDADLDHDVDFGDLVRLANSFGGPGGLPQGDFNASGTVDGADYTLWAQHVGFTQQATIAQPAAKLLVVPSTGQVLIDARGVDSGLRAFLLRPKSSAPQLLPANFVWPFANSTSAALATPSLLVDFTTSTGRGWLNLGNVLPTLGASVNVNELWSVASYSSMNSDVEQALQPVRLILGDYDFDADVDSNDLLTFLSGWTGALDEPSATADYSNGDFDFDFDADSADLLGFLGNWTGALAEGTLAVVPEPQFSVLPLLFTLSPLFAWLRVRPQGRELG